MRVKEFFHAYSRTTAVGRAEEATGSQPRRAQGQGARRLRSRDLRAVAQRCTPKAREWFERFPKQAYWTEIESWFERPGDVIEFTMRRLPAAD